jgi:hypothetical protein
VVVGIVFDPLQPQTHSAKSWLPTTSGVVADPQLGQTFDALM